MKNYLFNHSDENTALLIQDYPYGFRLRTQIRYWIESAPKKGDRFCSQTMNPKTNRWNAPKKSTFYSIGVMFSDEKNHIHWTCLTPYDNKQKAIDFVTEIGGENKLNHLQKIQFNSLCGIHEVKENEFTGKKEKDFSIKWEKSHKDKNKCREVRITFDRPDGVKIIEIFEAMKTLNQKRLEEVFEIEHSPTWGNSAGTVRVCVRGGAPLETVSESAYKSYLASDTNVLREEEAI